MNCREFLLMIHREHWCISNFTETNENWLFLCELTTFMKLFHISLIYQILSEHYWDHDQLFQCLWGYTPVGESWWWRLVELTALACGGWSWQWYWSVGVRQQRLHWQHKHTTLICWHWGADSDEWWRWWRWWVREEEEEEEWGVERNGYDQSR